MLNTLINECAEQYWQITLYIGFYYSVDKVSAAHSPLVSFHGQGWIISELEYKQLTVANHEINYAQIEVILGDHKELVRNWYQFYNDITPHVYRNKINILYNKMVNVNQQHTFIRI
ncbi:exosortase-associated EpsI family protein [Desulfosarcina ovata]|uniref:exosortase-associated EpsI family protein n=1 Tax=Desulfosarcina ovata TaxID=83564 RepID=UPI001564B176